MRKSCYAKYLLTKYFIWCNSTHNNFQVYVNLQRKTAAMWHTSNKEAVLL